MANRSLIIVTGLPGTGKTTIAKRLSQELGVPCFGRDDTVKEALFDELGYAETPEWSHKLGRASYGVLYRVLAACMVASQPVLVESNFSNRSVTPLQSLLTQFRYRALVVDMTTDDRVRRKRFADRAASGERHPGHHDDTTGPAPQSDAPLALPVETWHIDTTSFDETAYTTLRDRVRTWLESTV